MRRAIERHKRKKQKKFLIIGSLSLLLFLCVGYAAFSTNLSLKAKGNIKEKIYSSEDLKNEFCNTQTGDGLYADIYEDGKCIYKGSDPNNYIMFNDELWRIISIESDGTFKIMYDGDGLGATFDHLRNTGYCMGGSNMGCNAWAATSHIIGTPSVYNGINRAIESDSQILTYLNEYLNTITDLNKVVSHNWNIGGVVSNEDLASQIENEKAYQWNGRIGLITVSEYILANSNTSQCGNISLNNANTSVCPTTNWMYNGYNTWFLSPLSNSAFSVWYLLMNGSISTRNAIWSHAVQPVVYLDSSLQLTGMGTEDNPFTIKEV